MKRWLWSNLGWKLLSLALATMLWLVVAREPELATSVNVPVEFKNLPDDLDISSDVPERVHLEIRGLSRRLARENLADAAVVLDLSNVGAPGERTFTFQDRNIRLPVGVRFYKAVPSQVTLRFERLISKAVRIQPRFSSGPEDGYAVASSSFSPPTALIVGPESHVQPIQFVRTDPIDLGRVAQKAEIPVHLNVGDPQVRLKTDNRVIFKVTLKRKN